MISERKINHNSTLIAIAIASNYIAVCISSLIGIPVYSILSVLVFIAALLINKIINLKSLVWILIFSYLPLFSAFFIEEGNGVTFLYFEYFVQALLFAFCINYAFDFKKVCRSLVIIYLLFFWGMLTHNKSVNIGGELMGWSYAILPAILVCIYIIFTFPYKNNKALLIISWIELVFYINYSFQYITRGAVLAVILFCMILFTNRQANIFQKHWRKFFIFALVILFALFYKEILLVLDNSLTALSIKIPFISEITSRALTNTELAGRDIFYAKSFQAFLQSPIIGNGTAAYARIYNSNYDHNLILQLLNEGGIIYALINLIPLIYAVKVIFTWDKNYTNDYKDILLLLFCISVIRLMFSYTLWREQGYWMLMILIMMRKRYHITTNKSNVNIEGYSHESYT